MNNQNAIEILGGFNNARKRYASGKQIDRDRFDTFSKAIEMAIESLEITNRYRWIPVEERLPEANMIQREDGKILVLTSVGTRNISYYINTKAGGNIFFDGKNSFEPIAWMPLPKPYMPQNDQSVDKWNLIDEDYKEKLPKEDCDIWITRVMYTGERRVQKVSYCSTAQDIEWDGTIAWMVAQKDDTVPKPCSKLRTRVIQMFR